MIFQNPAWAVSEAVFVWWSRLFPPDKREANEGSFLFDKRAGLGDILLMTEMRPSPALPTTRLCAEDYSGPTPSGPPIVAIGKSGASRFEEAKEDEEQDNG